MRSDEWDKKESEPEPKLKRQDAHEHKMQPVKKGDERCIYCGKTYMELRNDW